MKAYKNSFGKWEMQISLFEEALKYHRKTQSKLQASKKTLERHYGN